MTLRGRTGPPWWLLVLTLFFGVGPPAAAQQNRPPPPPPSATLGENTPNPFYPATLIPFAIRIEECTDGTQPLVSLKIYNVLVQQVAVPVLQSRRGETLDNIRIPCGSHVALWDGRTSDGRADPPSGVYYYQLTVNGVRYTRKMIVRRAE
ncbi:MAG: T9SS type A sorting domain-containing protein [Actinomycetota bacterium]|nr:T9SS type A sorting domain-containing protein [Actinomycetota bacterium]